MSLQEILQSLGINPCRARRRELWRHIAGALSQAACSGIPDAADGALHPGCRLADPER